MNFSCKSMEACLDSYLNGRRHPVEIVRDVLKVKYPEAKFAFVAGSFQRGEATTSSDIDLVVIYENLKSAWRESFLFEGWPVEAFVHDPETLNYFFVEVDGKDGTPSLPSMVFEGQVVPDECDLSFNLKRKAKLLLEGNPPKWDEQTIYNKRYGITDLVDDLRDPRNRLEASIIIGSLHEILGDFYFRSKGMWSASAKQIPRRMMKHDSKLGRRWTDDFERAFNGNCNPLISLVEEILKPYGGFLFDGYKRTAPPEWRLEER